MTCKSLALVFTALMAVRAAAHSMMTHPQSTSPRVCRLGGNPNPGTCPGPCDLTAIEGRFANFDSPESPAAKYKRGQKVNIKYQRNNHGPGGFVRHAIVPVNQMMNKAAHSRNAFSYNCFGARPVVADRSEKIVDHWGFSMVGNDGKRARTGYYASAVTIPDVIPDGKYVFGWVWYGGTGGPVSNETPYKEEPWWKGYFGDYWSCAFIEISGGVPLKSSYTPVFVNDMSKFSDEGCMAANDAPGICIREPCVVEGTYMKPKQFKNDNVPQDLTPANFGGVVNRDDSFTGPEKQEVSIQSVPNEEIVVPEPENSPSPDVVVTPMPDPDETFSRSLDELALEVPMSDREAFMKMRACRCLIASTSCGGRRARRTGGNCLKRTHADDQPSTCWDACCEFCRLTSLTGQGERQRRRWCKRTFLRSACKL